MRKAVLLALALALVAFPAAGGAAPGDPVQLNACGLIYDNTNSLAAQISGLDVKFTNVSKRQASVVNVGADINGTKQIIRDVGTFSPGIEIHHKYRVATGQFALPAVLSAIFGGKPSLTCSIESVEFADGTAWTPSSGTAARPTASNSNAINVTPSNLAFQGTGASSARLVLASGGGALSLNSDCGTVAAVEVLASTRRDLALRVTPKAAGSCTLTIHDINDNVATVSVTVSPGH